MSDNNFWKRLFDLVGKSGEKLVIVDSSKDDALIVLPLSDYELIEKSGKENEGRGKAKAGFNPAAVSPSFEGGLDIRENNDRMGTVSHKSKTAESLMVKTGAEPKKTEKPKEIAGEGYYFEPIE